MGNHQQTNKTKNYPLTHPDPQLHIIHLGGLRITKHNKVIHRIAQTLQANKFTWYFILTHTGSHSNTPPYPQSHNGYLQCTCIHPPCHCLAKLRPNILCVLGAPNISQTLVLSRTHTQICRTYIIPQQISKISHQTHQIRHA